MSQNSIKWSLCKEKKQRINLSEYAYGIISQDMDKFDSTNKSAFINAIILNYYQEFWAEKDHKKETRFGKDIAFNITVCDELVKQLYGQELEITENYKSAGAFIKAVLEDYVLLSPWKREEVCFKEIITEIQGCIDNNVAFKVRIGDMIEDIRPYRIALDYLTGFHYLICFTRPHNQSKDKETLTSYRVSRLDDNIHTISKQSLSGKITYLEEKGIKDKLKVSSPAFLQEKPVEVIIKFTEKGKRDYRKILHFRPQYTFIERNNIYHFTCTEMQALRYFVRLGGEIEVISPPRLRKNISKFFKKGYDVYFE